jgi:RES domain
VEERVLSTLHVSDDVVLADCTASAALAFGVTAAIHSSESYERTQEWAAALSDAGFGGVRYLVSHDPAQRLAGVALFGPAGAQDRHVAKTGSIDPGVILAARERFGIIVLPAPA